MKVKKRLGEMLIDSGLLTEERLQQALVEQKKAGLKLGQYLTRQGVVNEQQVIDIHCGRDYRIFMLGFLPGFPYLGGMDERIVCPRLQTPRTKIPAGAVGIGGKQTGIYPLASPGGWQLIGRTPLRLFDPAGGGKLPYAAGDRIRFVPISPEKFETIQKEQGAAL